MNNIAYELTRLEIPAATWQPKLGLGVVSCPHCHGIDIINSTRNQKCPACGMLYSIEPMQEGII